MIVTADKTNVSAYFYIVGDADHAKPGEPVTGLLFSDIETGGSASYCRQGAARVDLTLVTLASAAAAHADGGFIEVDATNMPGLYRCDYPDAAFATGVDEVTLQLVVAAANNALAAPLKVQILDVDLRDSVRGGMTALPNANADAAGGLPVSIAGSLDLDAMNTNINDIETDTNELQVDWADGGRLDLILDSLALEATVAALNDLSTADIDARLAAIGLDHLVGAAVTGTDIVDDSIIAKLVSASATADWDDFVPTTDSLQALRDAVALEATVAALNNLSTADIDARLAAIGLDHLLSASVAGTDVADNSIFAKLVSKSATADWDDFVNTTDSLQALRDDLATAVALATVDTVVDGIQTDLDNATDGLGALKALIDVIDTVVDGIQTDLDNATDGLGALKALIDTVDTVVDAIKAVTDLLPDAGALNDLATILADTNELQGDWADGGRLDLILDATKALLDTTAIAERTSGAPPATPAGIIEAVMYLYMQWRNGHERTATERRLKNDAGTEISDATMSDDGTTFDSGKMGAP